LKLAQGGDFIDPAAVALARCGDLDRAESIASDLGKRCPLDTIINEVTLPVIRATAQIKRGQPARAVELLRTAAPYELRDFAVPYTRGLAYLAAGMGSEAAAEFQKILNNQGVDPISPYYPLARVGLARAYAVQRDKKQTAGARTKNSSYAGRTPTATSPSYGRPRLSTRGSNKRSGRV
jgi:predicted Zn-dependent protease